MFLSILFASQPAGASSFSYYKIECDKSPGHRRCSRPGASWFARNFPVTCLSTIICVADDFAVQTAEHKHSCAENGQHRLILQPVFGV